MPFEFNETGVKDVMVVEPQVFDDDRGFFMETYVEEDFAEAGIDNTFIQDNHSRSGYGVLRGLHFQKGEYSQAKLVRATRGIIFDVAVDLRQDSPTFGENVSIILSEHNKRQLFVPRGFAHGFATLSDFAEAQYKVDNVYAPDEEAGIIWDDPDLSIQWPLDDPLLSEKDQEWPKLDEANQEGVLFD